MSDAPAVVTRFAPSPTGFLHIGGARTALFNWLFARKCGGKFLLRIEDTDRARSTTEAVDAIIDGLDWLGLTADEPPLFQASRASRHSEVAAKMVETGGAFACYLSAEEEKELKDAAFAEGRAFRSPWRDKAMQPGLHNQPHTVRLRAPGEDVVVHDVVQGDVRVRGADIDDFVLLRTDGTPTYMLAVVVDDADMGVTHVIRGDDHLVNAARQLPIIRANGWLEPVYAHVPLIHGPDGKKLSKRHGAVGIEAYREMGYLPEGMRAYLLRLGWSQGDLDIVSSDEAIALFDLEGLGKSPARLDFDKMGSVNAHFIKLSDNARLAGLTAAEFAVQGRTVSAQRLEPAMAEAKLRAKTVKELADQTLYLVLERPVTYDEKAAKQLSTDGKARLARLIPRLQAETDWTAATLKALVAQFVADEGVPFGQVGPLIRAALTGGAVAPDLGISLALLGAEEAVGRLQDACSVIDVP
jgi:glutamyl-tRNA synthetase